MFFFYTLYIHHILGILPPTRARARRCAGEPERTLVRKKPSACRRLNTREPLGLSYSAGGARTNPSAPGYGYPVRVVRATVPSQIPLRGPESHSETISAPGQYETLETLSKALRLAYSASGPPDVCTARRSTTGHEALKPRTALHPAVVTSPGVAILTALTRQKSHSREPISEAKEIGCYRQRGGGRGCDPAHVSVARPRPVRS